MRKVLSFVLVLSLVLGSFSMAFAATPKDVVGLPSEDAVAVLSDLGVVSGYDDGTYKPENIVTRAEMAVLVIRALGLTDYVTNAAKSSFSDMAGYGWAEGYIAYAQSLGFVSGYPDGTFKPGKTVSYDEAASMLVRALGYTTDSLTGTWPANFVVKAKALGILDGIKSGAAGANRGDVAIMLYQTLDCPIGTVDKEGKWEAHKDKNDNPNDTMLTRLGAELVNGGNDFVLTTTDSNSAVVNVTDYVGALVKAYANKDGDIIAIAEVNSVFITGSYDESDAEFDADTTYNLAAADIDFQAVAANGTKSVSNPLQFVNGQYTTTVAITGSDLETLDTVTIAAKVSGKTIKEVYSVTKWNSVDVFQFEADMLEDDALNGYNFALDDNDEIDLDAFSLLGVDSLDKIAKDNVVNVYLKDNSSITSDIIRVTVGTETAKGRVTLIDRDKFTIDGKVYTEAENRVGSITLGDTGTAYLNYDGEITFWDVEDASSDNYAVVTGAYKEVGRDSTIVLMTKDGKETEFVVKDSAANGADFSTVTGTGGTAPAASAGALNVGDLVTFSTNKSGTIDKLTAVGVKTVNTGANIELSKNRTILDNARIDSGIVVFVADDVALPATDYALGSINDVETGENLVASYYIDGGKVKALIVTNTFTGSDSVYAVLNGANNSYDDNGDAAQLLKGFAGGKAYTAYTDGRGVVSSVTNTALQIWQLKVDSAGTVVNATTTAGVQAVIAGTVDQKDGNGLIFVNGQWRTIDPNAVVYEYTANAGSPYKLSGLSSVKATTYQSDGTTVIATGSAVSLFQLDSDSEVYDLIIINKN